MRDEMRGKGFVKSLTVAVMVALLGAGLLLYAGCESEQQQKAKEFKARWTRIMQDFDARVAKDDKKAQDLVAKNDLAGVIKLVKQRVSNVDEVLGEILELYPPRELRKLQALTSYYLVTLEDRLEAQNALYEAVLANKPTTDLSTVQDELITRSQIIARELGIEVQKDGITLQVPEKTQGQRVPSSTPSSVPSSGPETQ